MGKNGCPRVGCKGPHSTPVCAYVPPSTVPSRSSELRSEFAPLAQAGVRLHGVGVGGVLIASSRFVWPGARPGPRAGMKTTEHGWVPWAGGHQGGVKAGLAAVLSASAGAFFCLISSPRAAVAQSHSSLHLAAPLPAPSQPQGIPRGRAGERGLGRGVPVITPVTPISAPDRGKLPPQR